MPVLKKILHDIRNMRTLTENQMKHIEENTTEKEKMALIKEYNTVIPYMTYYIDNYHPHK